MGSIHVGVTGTGETSIKNATALITDWAQARPDDAITFVLDLTLVDGELPRAVRAAARFALASGLGVEAIIPQDQKDVTEELYTAVLEAADLVVKVTNPPAGVARRSQVLFIAWHEVDDEGVQVPSIGSLRALEAAEKLGIPAHDLTEGLLPLAFDDGAEAASEPAQEEPLPAPRTDESTSAVRPEESGTPGSDQTSTVSSDMVEAVAAKVTAAVLAEVLPLLERVVAQTAPRPRGRPRKTTEED